MRFSFDLQEPDGHQSPTPIPSNAPSHYLSVKVKERDSRQSPPPSPPNSTPKAELQWFLLQNHPLFSSSTAATASCSSERVRPNLMAWDGASRLYFWDLDKKCLHRISIRLGEPDPSSIIAAYPSKVLQAETPLKFEVNKIAINGDGSTLLLVGMEGLCIMYLYGHSSSAENTIISKTVLIGTEIYFNRNNFMHILQICWHPYSHTHLAILSSDSVFRIFDLSTDLEQPEQEFYLQPVEPSSCCNASSICPVDFAFGGNHLWERFSVFILFSDGSVYIICPVVPFGSVHLWESILEIYNDAHTYGLKSANSESVVNSNMAISWLEATFPELIRQAGDGAKSYAVKAQPFVILDASVSLQGPLHKISHGTPEDSSARTELCEGRALSLLCNIIGKDSVLVTAYAGGQLQLDALADEIHPIWKTGNPPSLCVDSSNRIQRAAMICESTPHNHSNPEKDHKTPNSTVWLGHPPPLLRLAIVDLALPGKTKYPISMIADPLVSERIFCIHAGGIDSVVLHFLPFTHQNSEKEKQMRAPSVFTVLSTCLPCGSFSPMPSPLCGFVAVADSYGSSWILGLTCSGECVVLEMETWNVLLTDVMDRIVETAVESDVREGETDDIPTIISKELLSGPRPVLLPPSAPNLRSLKGDSIEGRSMLHQYFKLFHENYVEYAHKVYFELQHHGPHLKRIIDNQNSRLREMQQKLLEVERKQEKIDNCMDRAINSHNSIEERLLRLRRLPGAQKRPLSKAERDFMSELDKFTGLELDALRSTIEALKVRLQRHMHYMKSNSPSKQTQKPGRRPNKVQDDVSQLKSALAKLSLINTENSRKVKLLDSALRSKEISD
ncbi:Nuclear pore complex protein NUP88 [Striga hermonthica]|uniref:Nuclear pore complex protein NUP88 n=1 Tax=Striga hermonthica TaxID=68872 RepID=A0A9N7R4U1_STRHE|nr:Nuclear pore complex protein NUP88 [Striga hermonthica]